MTLVKFSSLLVLVLLIVACDRGGEHEAAPTIVASAEQTAEPVAKKACRRGDGYNLLPAGICLVDAYALSSERKYLDKEKRNRQRLTFAFSGVDVEQVSSSFSEAMVAAGYRVHPRTVKNDGAVLIPFTKKDLGTTYFEAKLKSSAGAAQEGYFFVDFLLPEAVSVASAGKIK